MAKERYNPQKIEPKWQKKWEKDKLYQIDLDKAKKNFYNLTMFPYPSGEALHVGHVYCYGGSDTYARFKRMQGFDVFEPMGFDAFGIHAENYAIKIGENPQVVVPRNVEHFREDQMKKLGAMFDWSREVNTTDPAYYKWTQWIFLQMYKAGLVERKKAAVDWCPSCKTVLANEQVIDGECERCKTIVEQKELAQWFFKITKYADRLLAGLDQIDWPERTKTLQRNWIGKKVGIDIDYHIEGHEDKVVTCFTTRPETNFGATFVVLAPEHPLVDEITTPEYKKEVGKYKEEVRLKNELERTDLSRDKTGVFTGAYCINDLNGYRMPIWVGDFVLMHFGSGAVVGVPSHDVRDFEFVQMANNKSKDKIEVIRVLCKDDDMSEITSVEQVWEDDGVAVNSDFLDGMTWIEAREAIMDHIEQKGWGKRSVSYRLHDWCISRQRYWGPPIPMVYCEACAERDRTWKALIIHGTQGSCEDNWFPWLKQALEQAGIEVACPTLPDSDEPDYKTRMKFLHDKYADWLDDNTVVIGHSSGCATALHLAEQYKLRSLVLVGPYVYVNEKDRSGQLAKDLGKATAKAVIPFLDREIDYKKVAQNTHEVVALFGKKDPWVGEEYQIFMREHLPDIRSITLDGYGHFTITTNDPTEFPEILDFLPPLDDAMAGWSPVPMADLPVRLPEIDDYLPDGSGRGPLSTVEEFVNTTCPKCGGPAARESDVSDTFLDSAWYQFRYTSTEFGDRPFDKERVNKWMPVDTYIGGIEHATMHLIYFRFVTMVLHDLGYIDFDEPAKQLRHQGLIIKDGAKMSKSRGNVVNPDEYIAKFGADAFRTYMLFIGPYEDGGDFNDRGILGVSRFFEKLWDLITPLSPPLSGGKQTPLNLPLSGGKQTPLNLPLSGEASGSPPDKGDLGDYIPPKAGKRGYDYIPYRKDLTKLAQKNRKNPTPAEKKIWEVLNRKQFKGHKFLRQKPLDNYIVDFYCAELMLAIEIDGDSHAEQEEYDSQRTKDLAEYGVEIVRYTNNEVMGNIEGVYDDLVGRVEEREHLLTSLYQGRDTEVPLTRGIEGVITTTEGEISLAKLHATIKKVGDDIAELRFNTAIAALMELGNWIKENQDRLSKEQWQTIQSVVPRLLAPFAPHLAEELWSQLGFTYSVHDQHWPTFDESRLEEDIVTIAVQVNGKLRDTFEISKSASEAEVKKTAAEREKVQKWTEGKKVRKEIYVPGKLVNIVVG